MKTKFSGVCFVFVFFFAFILCMVNTTNAVYAERALDFKKKSPVLPVMPPPCIPDAPFINPSVTTTCAGSVVVLSIGSGNLNSAADWFWYSGSCGGTLVGQGTTVILHPMVSNDYFARGEGGCVQGICGSVHITVNPLPVPNPGLAQTVCRGDTAFLGATGLSGHFYSWSSSPSGYFSSSDSTLDNPLVTTTYYVTDLELATNCFGTDSVQITVNQPPTAGVGWDRVICSGDSTAIGAPGLSTHIYSWTSIPAGFVSDSANPFVSPSFFTFYHLDETDNVTGCTQADDLTVSVNFVPLALVAGSQDICLGDSIQLANGPLSGHSYSWTSNPSGFTDTIYDPFVSPLIPTVYYLTETITATGCHKSDSVTIGINPSPLAITGNDTSICNGNPVYIGAPSIGGNIYSWSSNPSGFSSGSGDATVFPDVTTTYYLTETIISTSCQRSDSIVVSVNPIPSANVGSDHSICLGSSTTIGSASVPGNSYSWTSDPPGFTSSSSNPTVSPLVTTTYYLAESINSTLCSNSDSVIIYVNPLPLPDAGSDATICAGAPVGIGTPAVSDHTYSWTSNPPGFSTTTADPVVSPGGTKTYFLIDHVVSTGCTSLDSVTITVNPLPAANAGPDHTICVGASANIGSSFTSGHSYSWSSNPPGFSATSSNLNVSPGVTTTYFLSETINATGCHKEDTTIVTVNASASANTGNNSTICSGNNATIGINTIAGHTYSWVSNPAGFSSSASDTVVSPVITTIYTLHETVVSTGCILVGSVSVLVNPLPDANTGPALSICAGANTSIGVPGVSGNTYSWTSNPPGFTSSQAIAFVSPVVNTNYYLVETTTATSCSRMDSVMVTIQAPTPVEAGANATICSGNSVAMNASSGVNYSWSPTTGLSNPLIFNPVATPANTTVYTVTSSSSCGIVSDTVRVLVNPTPQAYVGTDTAVCLGSLAFLGGPPVPGNLYSWFPVNNLSDAFSSHPVLTLIAPSTYTLSETNPVTGCLGTNSITVNVDVPMAASVGPDITICSGTSTTLNATGGSSFSWSPTTGLSDPLSANPVASPLLYAQYIVTATNACTTSNDTLNIFVNSAPLAVTGNDTTICLGASVTIGSAPVSGHTYSWLPTAGLTGSTTSNTQATPSGTTTYTLTETITATSCAVSHPITVTVLSGSGFSAGSNITICSGDTAFLNASGGASYTWSDPGLSNSAIANPFALPTAPTTYHVQISNSCVSLPLSVDVFVNPLPQAFTGNDTTLCHGMTISIGAPPVGTNIYSWNPDPTLSDITSSNPSANPLNTATYTLTETDGNTGCMNSNEITVTVAYANVSVSSNSPVCTNDTLNLYSPSGIIHSWSGPGGFISAQQDTGIAPVTTGIAGTYTLTMTSVSGCQGIGSTNVLVNNSSSVNAVAFICFGDSVFLGGHIQSTPGVYLDSLHSLAGCDSLVFTTLVLNPSYHVTSNITICQGDSVYLEGAWQFGSGTYTDSYLTVLGCDSTVDKNLIVHLIDPVFLGNDTTINFGESLTLNAGSGYTSYHWSTGGTGQTIVAGTSGFYWVQVTDSSSCISSDSIQVHVLDVLPNGIYSLAGGNGLMIYPNPASGIFHVDWYSEISENITVVLRDVLGRVYENKIVPAKAGQNSFTGDMSGMDEGVYFITLKDSRGERTEKLVNHK